MPNSGQVPRDPARAATRWALILRLVVEVAEGVAVHGMFTNARAFAPLRRRADGLVRTMMITAAAAIAVISALRWADPEPVGGFAVLAGVAVFACHGTGAGLLLRAGRRRRGLRGAAHGMHAALRRETWHLAIDACSGVAVAAGVLLAQAGIHRADAVAGWVIAGLIVVAALVKTDDHAPDTSTSDSPERGEQQ